MMYELPLFPLNTVLFPNMPIALHIFEPRYKLMIEQCLDDDQPFGVVLIREGVEAFSALADPHPIGCTAQITQVERLPDGRMNIVAVGGERFQIHALSHEKPYLTGTVETFPLASDAPYSLTDDGQRLRPLVERYLGLLAQVSDEIEFEPENLPDDPIMLGYLAAALLQVPTEQKQTLLAQGEAISFMSTVRQMYRREVPLMSALIERESRIEQGSFSLN